MADQGQGTRHPPGRNDRDSGPHSQGFLFLSPPEGMFRQMRHQLMAGRSHSISAVRTGERDGPRLQMTWTGHKGGVSFVSLAPWSGFTSARRAMNNLATAWCHELMVVS